MPGQFLADAFDQNEMPSLLGTRGRVYAGLTPSRWERRSNIAAALAQHGGKLASGLLVEV